MNSHTRSHSSAPIKTTKMLLPSYKKQSFVSAVCFWKKQLSLFLRRSSSLDSTSNDDPFQSLSDDYVDVFAFSKP
jgi:hypothetical protein